MLTFEQKLKNYLTLTLQEGVNLQPGQVLSVSYAPTEVEIGRLTAEIAYQMGAKYVDYRIVDERMDAVQVRYAKDRFHLPHYFTARGEELLDGGGARLGIASHSEPDAFEGLDPADIQRLQNVNSERNKRLMEEGISGMRLNWCLISPPSLKWAKKVFPELSSDDAVSKLWDLIFGMTFADKAECLSLWKEHSDRLGRRAEKLTALGIEELHFEGPGTDLYVGLTPEAVFVGGRKATPKGLWFTPNIPTFEDYTTPDWRRTRGVVRITKPSIVHGRPVHGLRLEFKDGEVVNATAEENQDIYRALIATDPGASRLGEVALVGTDSPIHQSGVIFHHTLYDENAACHIATGRAYAVGVKGGREMSEDQLTALGVNNSKTHHDVMISDERVNVTAKCYGGETVKLIVNGAWVAEMLGV